MRNAFAPDLGDEEVHAWAVPVHDPPVSEGELRALLADDERERAGLFQLEADRLRFVITRGMLRLLLGSYAGMQPADLRFAHGEHGKPALAGTGARSALEFNASHSGDWALIGVTRGRAVGVDIERLRPVSHLEGIVARRFTPREAAAIRSLPQGGRVLAFFACWTRKEACLKALGAGLSLPLGHFEVSVRPDDPRPLLAVDGVPAGGAGWSLWSLSPAPGYAAAVAVDAPDTHLIARNWSASHGMVAVLRRGR